MADILHEPVGSERVVVIDGVSWVVNAGSYGAGSVPMGTRVYYRAEYRDPRVASAGWEAARFAEIANEQLVDLFRRSAVLEMPPGVDIEAIIQGAINPGVFVPAGGVTWNVRLVLGVNVGAVRVGERLPPQRAGVCFWSTDGRQFRFFPLPREQHPAKLEEVSNSTKLEWWTRAQPVERC